MINNYFNDDLFHLELSKKYQISCSITRKNYFDYQEYHGEVLKKSSGNSLDIDKIKKLWIY